MHGAAGDLHADEVRDEKVKVLHAIAPPTPNEVVRAQYTAGMAEGSDVVGYLDEEGVPDDSNRDLRGAQAGGRQLALGGRADLPAHRQAPGRKVTEIAVTLKPVPHLAFEAAGSVGVQPNQLIMTMQPNEGVSLSLGAKIPGTRMRIRPVNMEFLYGTVPVAVAEAYERLILDAMRGDATLFTRDDEVEAQWRIIDPILESWQADDIPLYQYPAGTGALRRRTPARPGDRWRPSSGSRRGGLVRAGLTPATIEAAVRGMLKEQYSTTRPSPARC